MEYYSHTDGERKERVEEHLNLVAEYAGKYAGEIGYPNIGYIEGYFHDPGKFTRKFQEVLQRRAEKINHAIPGAAILFSEFKNLIRDDYVRQVIYGLVKGHHAGLTGEFDPEFVEDVEETADAIKNDFKWVEDGKENALSSREEYDRILEFLKSKDFPKPEEITGLRDFTETKKMLLIRLLFSCLVDGDYTATYLFEENRTSYEPPETKEWDEMGWLLKKYRMDLTSGADTGLPINRLRNTVYNNATVAGMKAKPGIYKMTAPTGTAKTLAMLSFAIECAKANRQKRIFVVLPYLSIIDQTVDIYRKIFGEKLVLEDDSTADYRTEISQEASVMRLTADKWDNQIIITTNVKFYETLFSSKPKELRKLHNVANSVVLFDESQTLPADVMDLSINTLGDLTDYNTTILFSTATPPELSMRKGINEIPKKMYEANEIIEDTEVLYKEYEKIHKVHVTFLKEKKAFQDLLELPADFRQSLFVFNTTRKAWNMYGFLKKRRVKNVFILYKSMCVSHKRNVIRKVKELLSEGMPCILVSTQCIEAGVDLDFPVVCREYAPYPSIIQTFGRCNRSGKGTGYGFVFELDEACGSGYPDKRYRTESKITKYIAKKANFDINLNDLSFLKAYYKRVFAGDGPESSDRKALIEAVEELDFISVDNEYRIIDEKDQVSIVVPYEDGKETYERVRKTLEDNGFSINKRIMAEAHPVTVTMYAGKNTDNLTEGCTQLCFTRNGERYETNWFIMQDRKGYNPASGLIRENEGGACFS